jgi:hypothetical protein
MPVKITRQRGRPSAVEKALTEWAFVLAKELEFAQMDLDFVATGNSLNYEVQITKTNQVKLLWADYLKYSVAGRGRKSGGGFPPLSVIAEWIEVKGIPVPDGMSLNSFAYLIARKQQEEGNLVYRERRTGIPLDMLIEESFDMIADQMAFDIAVQSADQILKRVYK